MQFDMTPIILSLKVAFSAIIIVTLICVPISALMAKYEFPGKTILDALFTLPLVLPPTVTGFILLYLFGVQGPIGKLLMSLFHFRVTFTIYAAIIASSVVAFPLMYQSLKAAIESVDRSLENAARTLGAGEIKVFFTITLPLSWNGFIAGLVLAFARSLGEFGATLMVAGNIPQLTQTMPLAIYFYASTGSPTGYKNAETLVLIMTIFSFLVIFLLNIWKKSKKYEKEVVIR